MLNETSKIASIIALFCLLPARDISAHGGGLDANGCHTNHKTGEYHCHRSPDVAEPPVKKSQNGICHEKSSPYYTRTIHFVSYESMKACVDSGGRPPKV